MFVGKVAEPQLVVSRMRREPKPGGIGLEALLHVGCLVFAAAMLVAEGCRNASSEIRHRRMASGVVWVAGMTSSSIWFCTVLSKPAW